MPQWSGCSFRQIYLSLTALTPAAIRGTLTPLSNPSAAEAEWRALEPSAHGSFFTSWGWIGPWAAQAAAHTQLHLFRAQRHGETVGLAFVSMRGVTRRKGFVRVTQLQLNEHNAPDEDMIIEHNGILAAESDLTECWQEFARVALESKLPWGEVAFRSLTPMQSAAAQQAFRALRQDVDRALPAWVVPLTPSHGDRESLHGAFKKKTRQQMRQALREYEALGPLEIQIAATADDAERFFGEMEELHGARWAKVGQRGSFVNADWQGFHRAVIALGLPRGEVVLARVTMGGAPIGFVYGLVWQGRLYAIQTGFKPQERAALRSGYVSHFLLMQHLASRDITIYDFLPDHESSYKRHLAEPEQLLTTVRFQRPRLIFRMERLAVLVRDRLTARRHTPAVEPLEDPQS